jgi:hypothetical protein
MNMIEDRYSASPTIRSASVAIPCGHAHGLPYGAPQATQTAARLSYPPSASLGGMVLWDSLAGTDERGILRRRHMSYGVRD